MGQTTAVYSKAYPRADKMLVAVDNVIFGFDPVDGKLKVLVIRRPVEPFMNKWSLIGSFVDNRESAEQAANRILFEFTGLSNIFLEQFKTYSLVDRDPGSRVISIGFYSLIRIDEKVSSVREKYGAEWFDYSNVPDLVIDHNNILNEALIRLQERCKVRPIGLKLLPDKFTLPSLLTLYEQIFQTQLDDRNFRKKILSSGLLKRLNIKDKSSSKKGAYLYEFDQLAFQAQVDSGLPVNII